MRKGAKTFSHYSKLLKTLQFLTPKPVNISSNLYLRMISRIRAYNTKISFVGLIKYLSIILAVALLSIILINALSIILK